MKKLTAGIFAGILTIVTVNAADAAIATSGYVTEKVGAVDAKVGVVTDLQTTAKTNTVAAINEVKGAVDTNKTNITRLQETVDGLANGDGSVASQIADALGADFPENSTVQDELEKKANKKDLGTMAAKNAEDYSTTAQMNAALANKLDTSKATVAADANYIKSGDGVATNLGLLDTQVKGNADSISGINTKIGTLPEGETSVVTMIQKVETAAGSDLTDKLGEGFPADSTVKAELDKKQNLLNNTNVKVAEDSTGNAVTAVTAENGTVTVTLGKSFIEQTKTTGAAGHYVLTADVSETGVTNYQWEKIDRATSESTGS